MLRINNRNLLLLFLVFIFQFYLFIGPDLGFAEAPGEEVGKVLVKSALVTIERKTEKDLLTDRQLFLITGATKFFDINGEEISLGDLPVPCKAQIFYEPVKNSDPHALKIIIKEILPGANTAFLPPLPE